jgi:putative endopeptidase
MAEVASTADEGTLHAYFRWMSVSSCAPYLSKPFVNAHFDFYEKTLQGTQEIKERWKRAMEFTENALGEALGKLYCAKYFDETSKERALAIVEHVRLALENRLKEVEWMKSEVTRANALKKMDRFGVKIGYPDKWLDYSTLLIEGSDDFLTMVFRSREFANKEEAKEIHAPTDKSKWFMTPQTVNAYYHVCFGLFIFILLLPNLILYAPICHSLSQILTRLFFQRLSCSIPSSTRTLMTQLILDLWGLSSAMR